MTYELKIKPEYLNAILKGDKHFEIRYNDKGYKVGDYLILREYTDMYTGRFIEVSVTNVLEDKNCCKNGYVVLSIKLDLDN